jgi:hypothetical protein
MKRENKACTHTHTHAQIWKDGKGKIKVEELTKKKQKK